MKNLKIFAYIVCLFFFVSCIEKINTEMHKMVSSKEHDERLVGWWQLINDENQYNCFDNTEFKFYFGEYNENGILSKSNKNRTTYYWYTENNRTLYKLRDRSLFYGNQKSASEYLLSGDGCTLSFKEGDEFIPSFKKVQ